jgi:isoleucyl-tRNA synthetase
VLRGSHAAQSHFPADLYLEGSDQHRGWFHSSLLTSSMLNGCPPYKTLLTHGFVVDGEGKKMSKSIGNVVAPQAIFDSLGADILRLWVAATDYSGELSISDEILKRVTESYRRIRNTLRFLLANTVDFKAAEQQVPMAQLYEIDRYALASMDSLQTELFAHYEQYEFHPAVAKLVSFCSEDLGGFYLDILKDRLYTSGADSLARRSAQTVLWHITQSLLRVMAPILSFTCEEAWAIFCTPEELAASDETIFTQTRHVMPFVPDAQALIEKFSRLRELRAEVTKQLEEVRVAGKIGSSLQAELVFHVSGEQYEMLASLQDDLKYIFITSSATVVRVASEAEHSVQVGVSGHQKCERCWHYRADVGCHADHAGLCGRCVSNLFGAGEKRQFA